MKKLFIAVMAVAAIMFASCGNKTEKGECADSCACQCAPCECDPCECGKGEACDKACGECPLKAVAEKLEAGDAEGVTAALNGAVEKIQALVKEGKSEEAQKIASAVKEFIETNKEKLANASVSVDNITSTLAALPTTITETVEAGAEAVKEDAKGAVEEKTNEVIEAGKAKVNEAADKAVEKTNEAIDAAAEKASKKLGL